MMKYHFFRAILQYKNNNMTEFRANSLSQTIPGELSLSYTSLTALRVRAAEGSIPHRIGGGLLVGGVYEWGLHTRNHAYVYGVSCCFLIPHVSLEEYSMLTPRNTHTCTAFSRVPVSHTFHAHAAHSKRTTQDPLRATAHAGGL